MPSISTHLNFLKLLNNRGFNDCDNNFFLLGSIAPDYYIRFYDEKMGCISHFKKSIFNKSNLNDFVKFISNKEFNNKELSYIKGYYSHLWLDNYFHNFGDCMEIDKPKGMEENGVRQFIKENIRIYDIKSIREKLVRSDYYNCSSEGFLNVLPISIEKSIELLEIFINSNLDKTIDVKILTVIKKNNYYRFLEGAIKTFIDQSLEL